MQWAPLEDCKLPGATQARLPFVCPMVGAQESAWWLLVLTCTLMTAPVLDCHGMRTNTPAPCQSTPPSLCFMLPCHVCPTQDYVLDPVGMNDNASPMRVRWREYSFLENPRCPQASAR